MRATCPDHFALVSLTCLNYLSQYWPVKRQFRQDMGNTSIHWAKCLYLPLTFSQGFNVWRQLLGIRHTEHWKFLNTSTNTAAAIFTVNTFGGEVGTSYTDLGVTEEWETQPWLDETDKRPRRLSNWLLKLLLLDLASTVILGSESHETHDLTLLCDGSSTVTGHCEIYL
jgi:hypothetical protein